MIEAYLPSNINFENNGDITLFPTKCEVHCVINGEWEMSLLHPIDCYGRWKYIQDNGVIKAPLFGKNQLFRIIEKEKKDSGIEVTAIPIFMDAKDDCILMDIRPTQKNGQEALDIMMNGSKYKGTSDIKDLSTAYYVKKNLIEAIGSDDENSFLNRWGGEIYFDNYTIMINKRIGENRGYQVLYGRNIEQDGISEKINTEDVVTRIYPVAFNGRMISSNIKYVDSSLIDKYPKIKARFITYEDIKLKEDVDSEDDESIICNNQMQLDEVLRNRAKLEFDSNEVDKPAISINVNIVNLENTALYKDYKALEKVYLGDDVYCYHDKLGIECNARIIEITQDCIAEKTIHCVIGQAQYDYFKNSSSVLQIAAQVIDQKNNTLVASKISGIINLMNTNLRAQKSIAQKQDVRAILFEDTDPDNSTFGAMCLGTQGLQITKKRNETNTDWDWTNSTAIDFQTIYANHIISGVLSDKNGNFYLNMDTGELVMNSGTFKGKINIANIFTVDENGMVTIKRGSINLGNGKFIVTDSGDMSAKGDATFNGNIEGGTIGGWNIDSTGLYKDSLKIKNSGITNIYTWADLYIIRLIIMEVISPDSDMIEHYDFNDDGEVTSADYIYLKNRLKAL